MWICCRCQNVTEDYPNNDVCEVCKTEGDFEELVEDEKNVETI